MFVGDPWATLPGISAQLATWENGFGWGREGQRIFTNGYIAATAIDPGNSPTYELRPGLVMGRQTTSGQWVNYSATATDGSQVAQGIFVVGARTQNVQNINQALFITLCVGGPVKSAYLFGLDQQARQQMRGFFDFDDDFPGQQWYPIKSQVAKTANYAILQSDNNTLFTNQGALGEVDFTLPPILNGYFFGFRAYAAQTLKVISNEGANMIAFNNAAANSVAYSTGGSIIGGAFWVYSDPSGTFWIVENASAGSNTVTVA
jgi:hypothetical protein